MTDAITLFVEEARAVSFGAACDRAGVPQPRKGGQEYEGPCPRCGGKDRFSVNGVKGVFNCRGCGAGGRDGIGVAAHMHHLDVSRRSDFLQACSIVLGLPVPQEAGEPSADDMAAREARMAEAKALAEAEQQSRDAAQNAFREREIERGRGIWLSAVDCRQDTDAGAEGAGMIRAYLTARTGFEPSSLVLEHLRFQGSATYWHGTDLAGRPHALYAGPALVAPILDPLTGDLMGSQSIWFDLRSVQKRRPRLWGLTREGFAAGFSELEQGGAACPPKAEWLDAGFYEPLSSKKMRGAKKGGVIAIWGQLAAPRWMAAEGIENTVALASMEGWREDTFYCAAGDIGNMAGPAEQSSAFSHPSLTMTDKRGHVRPVRVQGPVPREGSEAEAMRIPLHVRELVLPADGDSEPVATASAMARAVARHGTDGRQVLIWWPPEGLDFATAALAASAEGMEP